MCWGCAARGQGSAAERVKRLQALGGGGAARPEIIPEARPEGIPFPRRSRPTRRILTPICWIRARPAGVAGSSELPPSVI